MAETKGSMSSLQLRDIEKAKINCARKLFHELMKEGNVRYGVVKDYETLRSIVMDQGA